MKRHRLRQLFRLKKTALLLIVPESTAKADGDTSAAAKVIGWASVAVGVAALGVFVGRELRLRYKFKRRTPYDFYAHSAENVRTPDYGVGV